MKTKAYWTAFFVSAVMIIQVQAHSEEAELPSAVRISAAAVQ